MANRYGDEQHQSTEAEAHGGEEARHGPADFETLAELHRLIAVTLLERVKSGQVSPSLLEACRKFLADNGVNVSSIKSKQEAADALEGIIADLPFDDEAGEGRPSSGELPDARHLKGDR